MTLRLNWQGGSAQGCASASDATPVIGGLSPVSSDHKKVNGGGRLAWLGNFAVVSRMLGSAPNTGSGGAALLWPLFEGSRFRFPVIVGPRTFARGPISQGG